MEKLGSKMAAGAAWMVLIKVLEKSIGLISTLILARLLVPEDFGLVAMAMVVIALLDLLWSFNFDLALIQNQDSTRDHYNTAWSFNVAFGLISGLILVLSASTIAGIYEDPRLEEIITVLALSPILQTLTNIGIVDFRKELTFQKEFKFLLINKLVGFFVTITLALTIQNYWALIFGTLANRGSGVILSYIMHPFRPKISFSKGKELFSFSGWLLINNALMFLKFQAADVIVGKMRGGHDLGVFSISFEISNLPTTELVAPINRAVFPGYSKMNKDLEQMKNGFLDVLSLIFILSMPIGIGILITAPLLVPVFLGEKWLETIPLIQVLAMFGVISSMQTNIHAALLALGKPRTLTAFSAGFVLLLIPSLIFSVDHWGVIGAAWDYLAVNIIILPFFFWMIKKLLHATVSDFIGIAYRPIISCLIMYGVVSQLLPYFNEKTFFVELTGLLLCSLLGAVVYIACVLLFWQLHGKPRSAETFILEKVQSHSIYKKFVQRT